MDALGFGGNSSMPVFARRERSIMDETPLLARHPLHTAHRSKPSLPRPSSCLTTADDGSETEGVVSSEEELEWTGNERTPKGGFTDCRDEMEDDIPSTQLVDPRPLAGQPCFMLATMYTPSRRTLVGYSRL